MAFVGLRGGLTVSREGAVEEPVPTWGGSEHPCSSDTAALGAHSRVCLLGLQALLAQRP